MLTLLQQNIIIEFSFLEPGSIWAVVVTGKRWFIPATAPVFTRMDGRGKEESRYAAKKKLTTETGGVVRKGGFRLCEFQKERKRGKKRVALPK